MLSNQRIQHVDLSIQLHQIPELISIRCSSNRSISDSAPASAPWNPFRSRVEAIWCVRYAGGAVAGRWVWSSSRDWIVVDEVDAIGVFSVGLDMVVGSYGVE